MNEPEGYSEISKRRSVYYLDVQTRGEMHKCVGIADRQLSKLPIIMLEPKEALLLLAWLKKEKPNLEELAKSKE